MAQRTAGRTAKRFIDLAWDDADLFAGLPPSWDHRFYEHRMDAVTLAASLSHRPARVLDLACGAAGFTARMAARGREVWGLDPSAGMLQRARALHGDRLVLVRGLAERLPFRDAAFDRVVCKGSIDHFANPVAGMREMARVLRPDGRAVITLHNYGGATAALAPLLQPLARRAGIRRPPFRPTWEVPPDHTFRGTYRDFIRLGRQVMDLEACRGASLFFGLPFWPEILWPAGRRAARALLQAADLAARAAPPLADVLVTVWRHRAGSRIQGAPLSDRELAKSPPDST